MRGRTVIISLAAILSVILVSSAVFASGVLNTSGMSLFYTPVQPDQEAGGTVFADPAEIIVDYESADPMYQIDGVFPVSINITGVTTGIYTYAINLTWNPAVLNFSALASYGDFLLQTDTPEPEKTSRISPTFLVDYGVGTASIAETILGNDPDGVIGQGRLFTINFKVVGYGCSSIIIEAGAGTSLPTELLDVAGSGLAFEVQGGYFKNKLTGDANGDGYVNAGDVAKINAHWTPAGGAPPWSLGYSRDVDTNDDTYINAADIAVINPNWGRTIYP